MPNTKSAKKKAIQSEKKRQRNTSRRSMIRTFIKKIQTIITNGDKITAQKKFIRVQSILDRFATKGLIHKNKAARHKSKIHLRIKNMQ
ncbi:30S ribosomal protein S20 [Blochmannia endosymbiont of Camponotus (Colobopsis) obliquus]|uniref:30S ribosomal protein S20 n=1 Tax=Blochmannia endosymbiont of Camponotus (Colobopsis) obliquus TaxID=1505597 RepID=UPI00061A6606|nr:30S ribosomal protein S20 [Blochmannia endosymbiont of Camponotus (Colobopsis) obliquus]AKC60293.1 30S ribosomal protein S20 [Blochmannia endosymbiont of Camponotus (Colobopsis) obliquus]